MPQEVLIVEDDDDLRLTVALTLELAGYEVAGAASGEEALALIGRQEPDTIVLDVRLPGVDGWGVLDQLRETGRFPRIPVVIFSVYVDAATAASHGCAYLPKPFGSGQVVRTVRAALGHRHHG